MFWYISSITASTAYLITTPLEASGFRVSATIVGLLREAAFASNTMSNIAEATPWAIVAYVERWWCKRAKLSRLSV
jgi:hypothetical protein